jgi:hypothetical protein
MDYSEFAKAWVFDHREPTIDGYTISSIENGVETKLFSKLHNINVQLYFVVSDLLKIKGERLEQFASFAYQMLEADIKEAIDHHPEYKNLDDSTLYIEACEVLANSLDLHIEKIYSSLDCEDDDEYFPWYGLSKKVANEFGGPVASCAAVALGGIALAGRLIVARRYQYAWCAAFGSQGLASFSDGHLMSDEGAKAKYVQLGKVGATKRHAPMAELRKWAIEKYSEGKWTSANQAAHDLQAKVLEHGRAIGANLTNSNAQRTIAEWIRKSV